MIPSGARAGAAALAHSPVAQRLRVPLLVTVMLVSAACFVVLKAGLAYAPPLRFAALRLLVGGLATFAILLLWRQPPAPPRWAWPRLAALAMAAGALAYGAMLAAPAFTGAGVAAVLGNTQPLLIVALAALLLGEAVTRRTSLALLVGLGGVALVASPAPLTTGPDDLVGALLALASSAALAVGTVIVRGIDGRPNLLTLTAWQLSLGSLPLFAASLIFEPAAVTTWSLSFLGLLAFLSLAGTTFVTGAWYWLIQGQAVGRLSLVMFLVPAFGLGLAVWLFGETVSAAQLGGLVLIVLGLLGVARR